jgi:hypothetical protein|tara:strand:+ start:289 stop:477 length:189 start_codon:yes stop_codon:yes gene_type:complete
MNKNNEEITFTVMRQDLKTNESERIACVQAITPREAKVKFLAESDLNENDDHKYWIKYPICR